MQRTAGSWGGSGRLAEAKIPGPWSCTDQGLVMSLLLSIYVILGSFSNSEPHFSLLRNGEGGRQGRQGWLPRHSTYAVTQDNLLLLY